jgi:hypothetical protein
MAVVLLRFYRTVFVRFGLVKLSIRNSGGLRILFGPRHWRRGRGTSVSFRMAQGEAIPSYMRASTRALRRSTIII